MKYIVSRFLFYISTILISFIFIEMGTHYFSYSDPFQKQSLTTTYFPKEIGMTRQVALTEGGSSPTLVSKQFPTSSLQLPEPVKTTSRVSDLSQSSITPHIRKETNPLLLEEQLLVNSLLLSESLKTTSPVASLSQSDTARDPSDLSACPECSEGVNSGVETDPPLGEQLPTSSPPKGKEQEMKPPSVTLRGSSTNSLPEGKSVRTKSSTSAVESKLQEADPSLNGSSSGTSTVTSSRSPQPGESPKVQKSSLPTHERSASKDKVTLPPSSQANKSRKDQKLLASTQEFQNTGAPSPTPLPRGDSRVSTPSSPSPRAPKPTPTPTRRPQAPVRSQSTPTPTRRPQAPAPSQPTPAPMQPPPSPLEAQPREEAPKIFLSLQEAINLALVNNFDIVIERFNPKINTERVTVAESRFDPSVVADADATRTLSPAATQVVGSEQETLDFNAGFQQTLSPGTTYRVTFNNNRTETNSPFAVINPAYKSNVLLTVTQPLLRGWGITFNRAPILIARNTRDISVNELRDRIIQVISDVQNTYWDLVFAIGNLDARRLSLRLAEDLVRINRAQVEVGTLAPIEVLQAEASVAARKEAVIVAEEALQDTDDRLKRILNFQGGDPKFWRATIVPLDKPPFEVKEVSLEESIQTALQRRPEIIQARITLENRNLDVAATRNQLLPNLNFKGALGLNGLGSDFGDNLNELTSGDFYAWQAGVTFEFPIGNRTARSNHTIAKLEAEQAVFFIKNLEQQVTLEVRQAVRRLRTSIQRVEATRIAREFAERQLDAEQKKFNEGLSTNFNVLEFQEDLANAVSSEVRAITDYNKALVNLERVLGVTLDTKNIRAE